MADFVSSISPLPKGSGKEVSPGDLSNLLFGSGNVQYTQVLNGKPSLSINYDGVPQETIDDFRHKYKKGNRLQFFGNTFQVTNYSESVERFPFNGSLFFKFDISVTLESYTYLLAEKEVEVDPTNGSITSQDIAKKAGFIYTGTDFTIKNINKKESFSFISQIESRYYQFGKFFLVKNDALTLLAPPKIPLFPVRVQTSPLQKDSPNYFRYDPLTIQDDTESVDPLANAPVFSIAAQEVNYIAEGDPNPHICPVVDWHDESGELVLPATIGPDHPPIYGSNTASFNQLKSLKHWVNAARVLHYNYDKNGITKNYVLTKKIGETTIEVEELTYGFAFSCFRLATRSGNPSDYWRLVKYQKTNYIYEPLKQIPLKSIIKVKDPESDRFIDAIVDDDLFLLLNNNPPRYLTKVTTSGWRYARFESEDYSGSNQDIDGTPGLPGTIYWGYRYFGINFPRVKGGTPKPGWKQWVQSNLDLYLWRRVFFSKETVYELAPKNSIYKEDTNLEYEIIKVPASTIKGSNLPADKDGLVAIAFVNPNSVAVPYVITAETTSNRDIIWRPHPLSRPYDPDSKLDYNSDENVSLSGFSLPKFYNPTLPPYVLGESQKTVTTRKVIPNLNTNPNYNEFFGATLLEQAPPDVTINLPIGGYKSRQSKIDIYLQRDEITNLEVRDANLPKEIQEIVNQEIQGVLPEAEVLQAEFVEKPSSDVPKPTIYEYKGFIVDEPLNTQTKVKDETLTITEPGVLIRNVADFYYKSKIAFEASNIQIGYDGGDYKTYSPGNLLAYSQDEVWLIKESRLNILFNGKIITAESLELTLGEWKDVLGTLRVVPPDNTNNTPTSSPTNTFSSRPTIVGVPYLSGRGDQEPLLSTIDL